MISISKRQGTIAFMLLRQEIRSKILGNGGGLSIKTYRQHLKKRLHDDFGVSEKEAKSFIQDLFSCQLTTRATSRECGVMDFMLPPQQNQALLRARRRRCTSRE